MILLNGGSVGIKTATPAQTLDVNGTAIIGNSNANLFIIGTANNLWLEGYNGSRNGDIQYMQFAGYGASPVPLTLDFYQNYVGIGETTPSYPLEIACASTTWTDQGVIISCSDYAEVYQHSEKKEDLEAGYVLVLDTVNEGKVKASTKAYDRMVVGVLSGSPGMLIGNQKSIGLGGISKDTLPDGELPMALVGKVFVQVVGKVSIGDLLTTSDTRGKAMSCTNYDICKGAILGKAMTNNKNGTVIAIINLA
jgi:hypothetical protein